MGKRKHCKTTNNAKRLCKRAGSDSDDSDSEDDNAGTQRAHGNHLYFWCDVTKKSCLELTMQLNQAHQRISRLAYPGDDLPPIYIHINSYGGDVDAALGLVDTMLSLEKQGAKIITIIEGYAASAATIISISGSERRMRPNAYMRIHQFRSGMWGKKNDLDDEHANMEKLETIMIGLYKSRTTMSRDKLKKLLSRELDLLPNECIEKGLIDSVQE